MIDDVIFPVPLTCIRLMENTRSMFPHSGRDQDTVISLALGVTQTSIGGSGGTEMSETK